MISDEFFCGFAKCGKGSCTMCRVQIIAEDLEILTAKAKWEYSLRYKRDDDIRNCEHCKYVSVEGEAYALGLNVEKVYCDLEDTNTPHSSLFCCEKWERMPPNGIV